eukprot:CAMPEP_0172695326 /NCGR_PEP_ID=MMETSP1074-20121228/27279_1 /TAXON_ID=2916 /ORGANISM="Ceratium fusus, Strain PA161109" /LENGTH=69 /DNA_ID=CAMNT_0013515929 /DNA_START=423 /DNA_END=632 /DNA_ORIENTATION=+
MPMSFVVSAITRLTLMSKYALRPNRGVPESHINVSDSAKDANTTTIAVTVIVNLVVLFFERSNVIAIAD